jgi:hypothetical protein
MHALAGRAQIFGMHQDMLDRAVAAIAQLRVQLTGAHAATTIRMYPILFTLQGITVMINLTQRAKKI